MTFTAKAAKIAKDENELSRSILDAAFRAHSALGPGLLEGAYEACLAYELRAEGFSILTQVPLPLVYREVTLDVGYRLDLVVEELVVVEIKICGCPGRNSSSANALLPQTQWKASRPPHKFQCCKVEGWHKAIGKWLVTFSSWTATIVNGAKIEEECSRNIFGSAQGWFRVRLDISLSWRPLRSLR